MNAALAPEAPDTLDERAGRLLRQRDALLRLVRAMNDSRAHAGRLDGHERVDAARERCEQLGLDVRGGFDG